MNASPEHLPSWARPLGLQPHPEGGYYARLYRAHTLVRPEDGRPPRIALSAIHFLLLAGHERLVFEPQLLDAPYVRPDLRADTAPHD